MSQQPMTPDLAWQWIIYATRVGDARERIGELPDHQLITIGMLLEQSPIVHVQAIRHSPNFKPKVKTATCQNCQKQFTYEARGGSHKYCSKRCGDTFRVRKHRRKVAAQKRLDKVLKGVRTN